MSCLGYKGGVGTASRVLPGRAHRGSGHADQLRRPGAAHRSRAASAGRLLPAPPPGTGAPETPPARASSSLSPTGRSTRPRAPGWPAGPGLGLARTGSIAHHGSGEIFLALATGLRAPRGRAPSGTPVTGRALDRYFAAVVEATEEAVLNSLLQAETVSGRDGHTSYRLPADELHAIVAAPAGRR